MSNGNDKRWKVGSGTLGDARRELREVRVGGVRATFGRKQVGVLEKLFEGSKYLAGKDRRLFAQRLGMKESQIKVGGSSGWEWVTD